MAGFIQVVTIDGDRWDLIAYRCYGNALAIEPIIRANPDVPIRPVLPAGLTIYVPVREPQTAAASALPPWKRKAAVTGVETL